MIALGPRSGIRPLTGLTTVFVSSPLGADAGGRHKRTRGETGARARAPRRRLGMVVRPPRNWSAAARTAAPALSGGVRMRRHFRLPRAEFLVVSGAPESRPWHVPIGRLRGERRADWLSRLSIGARALLRLPREAGLRGERGRLGARRVSPSRREAGARPAPALCPRDHAHPRAGRPRNGRGHGRGRRGPGGAHARCGAPNVSQVFETGTWALHAGRAPLSLPAAGSLYRAGPRAQAAARPSDVAS